MLTQGQHDRPDQEVHVGNAKLAFERRPASYQLGDISDRREGELGGLGQAGRHPAGDDGPYAAELDDRRDAPRSPVPPQHQGCGPASWLPASPESVAPLAIESRSPGPRLAKRATSGR